MSLDQLEHVNIRCANVHRSRDFYVQVLGLREGPRPPFASVGYWLYAGDLPVVHLVQRQQDGGAVVVGGGAIDHVAFRGTDLDGMRARLRAYSVDTAERVVPHDGTIQLFVGDPDGVRIELNFAIQPD